MKRLMQKLYFGKRLDETDLSGNMMETSGNEKLWEVQIDVEEVFVNFTIIVKHDIITKIVSIDKVWS